MSIRGLFLTFLATLIGGAQTVTALILVHGPDANGQYGGLQGAGGVDGVVNDTTGVGTGVLADINGHAQATVSGTTVTWNSVLSTGYGPVPGLTAQPIDGVHDVSTLLSWREKYVDGTGFYYLGNRYYDPQSGTFLSCDPLGHAASMDLYSYCQGDPLNYYDADGRFQTKFAQNIESGYGFDQSLNMAATGTLQDVAVSTGNPYLAYPAGVLNAVSITEAQFTSPQVTLPQSYQANYQLYGDNFTALNATLNPAFQAEAGAVELYTDLGISSDNFGQTLSGGQKWMSAFRVFSGTSGTLGVGLGGGALVGNTIAGLGAVDAITTPIGELRSAGLADAHHVIQDAAVRDLEGYDTNLAPGVQLQGPSTAVSSEHYLATQAQRLAGGGTYGTERQIAIQSLRASGKYTEAQIAQIMQETDAYFNSIGVTESTVTRIPGNRR